MDEILKYIIVFVIGGLICVLAQILIIRTRMTSARILVLFELIGVFLQAVTLLIILKLLQMQVLLFQLLVLVQV